MSGVDAVSVRVDVRASIADSPITLDPKEIDGRQRHLRGISLINDHSLPHSHPHLRPYQLSCFLLRT